MKKFMIMAVVSLMMTFFAACGSKTTDAQTSDSDSTEIIVDSLVNDTLVVDSVVAPVDSLTVEE